MTETRAVQQGMDDLRSLSAGTPYEDATAAVLDDVEDSDLLDLAAAATEGPTDIAALLTAVDLPAGQGWPAFLDRVEEILTEQG